MYPTCAVATDQVLKRNIGLSKYESTSATCAYTNTQCCQSTIRNLIFKFVCRLNKSDNALIKAVLASSVMYSSRNCARRIVATDIVSSCIPTFVDNVLTMYWTTDMYLFICSASL